MSEQALRDLLAEREREIAELNHKLDELIQPSIWLGNSLEVNLQKQLAQKDARIRDLENKLKSQPIFGMTEEQVNSALDSIKLKDALLDELGEALEVISTFRPIRPDGLLQPNMEPEKVAKEALTKYQAWRKGKG